MGGISNEATFGTVHGGSPTNVGIISACVRCLTVNVAGVVGLFRPRVLYINNNVNGRNRSLLRPMHGVMGRRRCDMRDIIRAEVYSTGLKGSTNVVKTTLLSRWF